MITMNNTQCNTLNYNFKQKVNSCGVWNKYLFEVRHTFDSFVNLSVENLTNYNIFINLFNVCPFSFSGAKLGLHDEL